MLNVYLDPSSYVHLGNAYFEKSDRYNINNAREPFIALKEYCQERDINLNTIDFWDPSSAEGNDIYVAFEHKFILRKLYWKFKNKNYPIVDIKKFKKRILFQFEPPVVVPEIKYLIKQTLKIYDKVFFTWETDIPGIGYFITPLPIPEEGIMREYWDNSDRKFLTLINSNRSLLISYHKELITERIRAVNFFSQTGEIDLYGRDWDKPLPFPYWFSKGAIKKVYRGRLENKYKKLSEYKFAFAIENCELPGYVTEKAIDCFYVGTVPIYLGAPDIEKYIPRDCFIDMREFKNYKELRKFLKSLTESEIKNYRENGRHFLESEKVAAFTKKPFIEKFVEACFKQLN